VGHRQDTLRSKHTETCSALSPPRSEESPRALRQKVPPVKGRSPRAVGARRRLTPEVAHAAGPARGYSDACRGLRALEQNGAYSGGVPHRCILLSIARANAQQGTCREGAGGTKASTPTRHPRRDCCLLAKAFHSPAAALPLRVVAHGQSSSMARLNEPLPSSTPTVREAHGTTAK